MLRRTLIMALLCVSRVSFAQEGSSPTIQSDRQSAGSTTASGIGNLFNPNLYDGTASVNVPIYNFQVNGLDLNVGLSYDTHGIKVDQVASCVGLGWNLYAGGKITREIHDMEDEATIYSKRSQLWYDTQPPVAIGRFSGDRGHFSNRYGYYKETQSDVFTATFGGRTVSFETDGGNAIKVSPICKILVETIVENQDVPPGGNVWNYIDKSADKNILGFKIKDERGNIFIFTRGDYEIKEASDSCTLYSPVNWNLKEVITSDNQHVKYTYGSLPVNYLASRFEQVREVETQINWPSATYPVGATSLEGKDISFNGAISYLQKVEYPNGIDVALNYLDQCVDMNLIPLDKIKISSNYDLNFSNSKTYKFSYSFFQSSMGNNYTVSEIPYKTCSELYTYYSTYGNYTSNQKKRQIDVGLRLKLNEIDIVGTDETTTEPYYAFSYNMTNGMPHRLNPGRDYYGYYNGKSPSATPNSLLIGSSIALHSTAAALGPYSYGTDRTPDLSFMKTGILEKVTSGSGASLEIKYKDHVLNNPTYGYHGNANGSTQPFDVFPTYEYENANDGLCIDETIIRDGFSNDNTVITKYEFSDGQRFFRGGYSWVMWGSARGDVTQILETKIYTNNNIIPVQYINGSNHGYSYAEVKTYNGQNELQGSTKYHYTNLMIDQYNSNLKMSKYTILNAYPIEYFYSYRMGKLIDLIKFDRQGNPIYKERYNYRDDILSNDITGVYKSNKNEIIINALTIRYWNFYNIPFLLQNKYTTHYTNNGEITKDVFYTYNSRLDPNLVSWVDEWGNTSKKVMTYHYDLVGPNVTNYAIPYITELIRKVDGTDYMIDRMENTWVTGTTGGPLYNIGSVSRLINNEPQAWPWSAVPGMMVKSEEYTRRDSKGNITETRFKDKEIYEAAIWDTRVGQKLATVTNARFDEIAYTSFEGNFQPLGTADDNKGNWDFTPGKIYSVPPSAAGQPPTGHYYYSLTDGYGISSVKTLAQGKTYTVSVWATAKPFLVSSGLTSGFKQQFETGGWKLYTASVVGANQTIGIVVDPSSPSSLKVDELRLYPADGSMATTTYESLFGPNSISDERGNIRYLEYDKMGRQTVTRDVNRNVLSVKKHVVGGADTY